MPSHSILSAVIALALVSRSAFAQPDPADPTPLTEKTYAYPSGIPYQVDPVTNAERGPQTGYNIYFCLWAPPQSNSTIGDTEGEVVAWCSKPGYGTRLIPAGKYIQWAGLIDQTLINIAANDDGGELDPHGADLRGNPLGGLMYSNAFPKIGANNDSYTQIIDWTSFMGSNEFCLTICNPSSSSADQSAYCQNIYDEIGCEYNMPNNAQKGTFEVCDSDLKIPAGVYVSSGVTMTYTQPYDTGEVNPPYTPVTPSSSNCVTYQSSALYTGLPTVTTAPSTTPAATSNGTVTTGAGAAPTTGGASALGISSIAGIFGTLFAVAFLS
ncbi:hypothetical protein HD554DRAFT_2091984 [Boletus coccyginus]|nr:hypothetical protein HD554DRAFT_2091984 [Boletus coccyginus]